MASLKFHYWSKISLSGMQTWLRSEIHTIRLPVFACSITTVQWHLFGHRRTIGLMIFTVLIATVQHQRTTMKMVLYITAISVARSCALALGKVISLKTSTRPSAIKTCHLSMQPPVYGPNGYGISVLLTRSTLFVASESKQQTLMLLLSCHTLSTQEA